MIQILQIIRDRAKFDSSARSRSSESSITGPSSPTFETPEGAEDSPNRVKHADLVSEYFTAAAVPRGGSGEEDIERLINRTIEDLPTDELKQRSENSRHQQQSQQHKRRPNQGADTQSKFRKGFKQETYLLHVLDDDKGYFLSPLDVEAVAPAATLSDFEYREIFSLLGELFCRTSYRWLAQYRFRIPRKRYMKDHLFPADREMTEYVQIIKSLVEGREVPRNAVRDDRLTELVSVMEGAAEIRHVNIHVSRKQKPDRRVLGFIAAVNEFCWILGDYRAAIETNQLYTTTEQKILGRRQEDWPKPGSVMTSQMVEAN